MYSYQYSSAYQQPTSPTTEPTQPTDGTTMYSYQYSSSSAMETPQWPSSSTYQDPPSFSEETPRSVEVPSAYSYPDSSSQILTEPSQNTSLSDNSSFHCLHAGCTSRPFRRAADLQRHYKHTHQPESNEANYCDYPRCTRSREPFRRRDHFRDHLREYHREDIQKRGEVVNEEWLDDRHSVSSWWRCARCLIRVYVSQNNFECPQCKGSCEPKRKERRRGH
ncbi:Hypothetical protein NCS54_00191000 [Fusarium falciforme]|uniref:Hypothetical protein n=1 Tax=Fusarium falciforme TaxID=195108 RepID=UPI002301EECB|nr:Hypothetical protein NCS54_00191000 [Fusarium falciforme]WAO84688.1 Hypothetical protein NCS54_00191000 [Fusarium falciforme]